MLIEILEPFAFIMAVSDRADGSGFILHSQSGAVFNAKWEGSGAALNTCDAGCVCKVLLVFAAPLLLG